LEYVIARPDPEASMHPASLLQVKQQVLKSHLDEVAPVVQKLLKNTDPEKTATLLTRLNG